jgi:hypothetical protein
VGNNKQGRRVTKQKKGERKKEHNFLDTLEEAAKNQTLEIRVLNY